MRKVWGKSLFGRWPKSKKEEQEFGSGKKDFVMCSDCNAVYFEKSWHHSLDGPKGKRVEGKNIAFQVCPADAMRRDNRFEGELIIENAPRRERAQILNRAKNVAQLAYERDPMDRVLDFQDKGSVVRITTTENQLALKIGREIKKAFKGSSIEKTFSKRESPVRVRVFWEQD